MSRRRVLLIAGATVVVAALLLGAVLVARAPLRDRVAAAVQRLSSAVTQRVDRMRTGPPPSSVTISVDPRHVLRPISPLIYGVAHANPDDLLTLGASLNRWGGNPNSRFNWALGHAWNAARDWEFRNYGGDGSATGSTADQFVEATRSLGVETEVTIPALGWVARNGDTATRSIGVPAFGGPPLVPGSDAILGYDPSDNRQRTSVPSFARKGAPFVDPPDLTAGRVFQDEWVHHLVSRFGSAANGGVQYYAVDNEPDLWSYTHADVHPVQMSYDATLSTFLDYATAIKDVDPSAKVAGPAVSGWTALFYSALDQGNDRYQSHRDRQAHGDMPFLPWWLEQVRNYDAQTARRSLDILDVHFYPQESGVYGSADDAQTRGLRLRSTRALWDSSYVDESWINDTVRLIPRLREWRDQYYPGTQIAIGEWSWGAEKSTSGALAVADVLGIFGREGVDMASYWLFPPIDSPAAQAFAMYTRYDDRGDAFGDAALAATVDTSPDFVTAYASLASSTGDVVLIAINKRSDADVAATIKLTAGARSQAHVFRFAPGDTSIQDAGAIELSSSELQLDLAASSITLIRIAA